MREHLSLKFLTAVILLAVLAAMPAYAQRLGNNDGAAFRVRHGVNQYGHAFLFLAGAWAPFTLKAAGFQGTLPMDFLSLRQAPGGPTMLTMNPANGQVEVILAPPYVAQGAIAPFIAGRITWCAVTFNLALQNFTFTHGAAIIFG